jgi:putative hydrolase of the HAD superfamily
MKTLFLDFGNVLAFFDHQRAIRQLVRFTPLAAADLTAVLYDGPLETDYEAGRITTAEYVARAIDAGRLDCTPEQFLAAFVDIFTRNPDVCDLLPALAGRYRLVLASNTNDAHFTKYCQQFAADLRHFAHLGTSHRAGARKPHPDFFAYCQRFADAEPGECAFVDDLPANVEAARRHGWRGVLYRPGDRLADNLAAAGIPVGPASQ